MTASSCGYVPRPLNLLQTSFHFATFIWILLGSCRTASVHQRRLTITAAADWRNAC